MSQANDIYIETAVRLAGSLFRLPAYPALDWCDAAARSVAAVVSDGVAISRIVNHDPVGAMPTIEATGSASSRIDGDEGLHSLRAAAERLPAPPVDFAALPAEGRCDTAAALGLDTPDLRALNPFPWAPAEHVLWATVPLGTPPARRVLSLALARADGGGLGEAVVVIRAGLPLLSHRARLALGGDRPPRERWLSVRELAVLERLVRGDSIQEIAAELGRSPHTVHDHIKALHRKLGAATRGELIARALGIPRTGRPVLGKHAGRTRD